MYDIQGSTTHELAKYLTLLLPVFSDNWWQEMVITHCKDVTQGHRNQIRILLQQTL